MKDIRQKLRQEITEFHKLLVAGEYDATVSLNLLEITIDRILKITNSNKPLSENIGEYVELEKKGKSYLGLCPFHEEKTPSFTVNNNMNVYHCFGCGIGGSSIEDFKQQLKERG